MKLNFIRHGEVTLFEEVELPKNVKKYIPGSENISKNGLIVGFSETSGNHHCIEFKNDLQYYIDDEGTLFLVNKEPTNIFCSLDTTRHPSINVPPKIWRINNAQEFNLLERLRQKVRD